MVESAGRRLRWIPGLAIAVPFVLLWGCPDPVGSDWPDPVAVGAACAGDWECESGICFAAEMDGVPTGWIDGSCSAPCLYGACEEATACVALDGEAWCLSSCAGQDDCREGYVCNGDLSVCLPDCNRGWDCGDTLECETDGSCRLPTAELANPDDPCDQPSDCAVGTCFPPLKEGAPTGWSGGMCVEPCGANGACFEGFGCTLLDGQPWCLPACAGVADCRTGYVCNPESRVCLPDCNLGWDCGEALTCMPDGLCRMDWPPLKPIGSPCVQDAECDSGWCLEEKDDSGTPTGWIEGMCTVPCGGPGCPPMTLCAVLEGKGWCLHGCMAGPGPGPGEPRMGNCRPDYVCDPDFHVCLPSCLNEGWDCGPQYECRPDGVCGHPEPPIPPR